MGFFDKLKKINIFSSFGSELTDDFYDELEESLRTRGWTPPWSWWRSCAAG